MSQTFPDPICYAMLPMFFDFQYVSVSRMVLFQSSKGFHPSAGHMEKKSMMLTNSHNFAKPACTESCRSQDSFIANEIHCHRLPTNHAFDPEKKGEIH